MRNTLAQLPVLLCCLWGGALAGGAVFLLQLAARVRFLKKRGVRAGSITGAVLIMLDILTAAAAVGGFAAALFFANGGEPRLYAAAGYFTALIAVDRALILVFM